MERIDFLPLHSLGNRDVNNNELVSLLLYPLGFFLFGYAAGVVQSTLRFKKHRKRIQIDVRNYTGREQEFTATLIGVKKEI